MARHKDYSSAEKAADILSKSLSYNELEEIIDIINAANTDLKRMDLLNGIRIYIDLEDM